MWMIDAVQFGSYDLNICPLFAEKRNNMKKKKLNSLESV